MEDIVVLLPQTLQEVGLQQHLAGHLLQTGRRLPLQPEHRGLQVPHLQQQEEVQVLPLIIEVIHHREVLNQTDQHIVLPIIEGIPKAKAGQVLLHLLQVDLLIIAEVVLLLRIQATALEHIQGRIHSKGLLLIQDQAALHQVGVRQAIQGQAVLLPEVRLLTQGPVAQAAGVHPAIQDQAVLQAVAHQAIQGQVVPQEVLPVIQGLAVVLQGAEVVIADRHHLLAVPVLVVQDQVQVLVPVRQEEGKKGKLRNIKYS